MKAQIIPRISNSVKSDLNEVIPLKTPYSVHIDPSSLCNLKCKFCFQSNDEAIKSKGVKFGLMDMGLFRKIIKDICQFEDRIKKVKLGLIGEPTLHPELPDMIDFIRVQDKVDTIEMFTNGTLLDADLSYKLIEAGLDRINISIEGLTSEEYEAITGKKQDIGLLIKNISFLYKIRRDCKIYIKTITQDKFRFYDLFGNICDEIYVENIVPQWTEANKFPIGSMGMYFQDIKDWKEVCPFPFMYMHYNWDGTVSGCTLDWAKEVLIGNANDETALEIWNGEKLKTLRVKMLEGKRKEIPFCDKCLAPMVCCFEDLEDKRLEHLERIK